MSFPLGIFGTHSRSDSRFEAAKLGAWLDSLPPLDAGWFLQEVLSSLVAFAEADMKPRQRLTSLIVYRNKVEQINGALDRNLTQRGDDTSTHLYRVLGELIDGFDTLVTSTHGSNQRLRMTAMYFEMELLIQEMLLAYRLYGPIPQRVYVRVYALYRRAATMQVLYEAVDGPGSHKAQSIGVLFKQFLLTCITDPFHMADGEVNQLFAGMRRYTASLGLDDQLTNQDREALFIVATDRDAPPQPLEPGESPPSGDILFLDLGQVITDISRERQNEHLSHTHHLHFAQGARLLKQILPRFRGRTARRSERAPQNRPVAVVASLAELLTCLAPDTQKAALPEYMRVVNASAQGYCLQYDGNGIHFHVGETVAIYSFQDNRVNGPPVIGFTRWMRRASDCDVQLGVETVPGTPEYATVTAADDDAPTAAVLLHDDDSQRLLLPETHHWHAHQRLVLRSPRLNGVVELTENSARAQLSTAWLIDLVSADPAAD